MSLEIEGKLFKKYDTEIRTDKFRKREIVIEIIQQILDKEYKNYAKMQLINNKCEIVKRLKEGDMVKVYFNIKGNKLTREGEEHYITNLDVWRIEKINE